MIYLGIDPGKHGALAIIGTKGDDEKAHVIPFEKSAYLEVFDELQGAITKCCIEHVSAMPGQGVTSMFHFGENFGWLQGVLDSFDVPYELVRPQKWKKEFSITGDKNSSIAVCKRLFPDVSLMPSERCRKDHDGMAEALLMAEYARRRL